VSTYATAIHYTQRQITTRTTLHYNIEYQRPFRYHINIATPTDLKMSDSQLSNPRALRLSCSECRPSAVVTWFI